MNTSGKRLRELLDERGISYSDFASTMGVEPQHVNNWFNRGIPKSRLFKAADALGVYARWLAEGDCERSFPEREDVKLAAKDLEAYEASRAEHLARSPLPSGDSSPSILLEPLYPWDSSTPLDADEVELPLYKEVELAAGSGRTAVRPVEGRKLRFSYATLRTAGVSPAHAVCATVSGNSMEPLIMSGATIGIDRGTTRIIDGEIYALDHDGMLRVKLLYRLPGGGLRMRSFNQAEHRDEDYTEDLQKSQRISILGRVFWWSTVRPLKAAPLL